MNRFPSRFVSAVGDSVSSETVQPDDATFVSMSLFAATLALHSQWRRSLGLNAHEGNALMILWCSGSMTMSELGERIPLSRAAVTSLTDRLEQQGYVKRTVDEADRRRTVLVPTSSAAELLKPLWRDFADEMTALAESLDSDQWKAVSAYQEAVIDIAKRHAEALRLQSDDEIAAKVRSNAMSS